MRRVFETFGGRSAPAVLGMALILTCACHASGPGSASVPNAVGEAKGDLLSTNKIRNKLCEGFFDSSKYLTCASLPLLGYLLPRDATPNPQNVLAPPSNQHANPLAFLQWYATFARMAADIAMFCHGPTPDTTYPLALSEAGAKALAAACNGMTPETWQPGSLTPLWEIIVGFEAPQGEIAAFEEYVAANFVASDSSAAEKVRDVLLMLLLNPYFLLST